MPLAEAQTVVPDGETLIRNVADGALARLNDAVVRRMAQLGDAPPRAQLQALGMAYLEWALGNSTHLMLVTDRYLTAQHTSPMLQRQGDALGEMLERMLDRARAAGDIDPAVDRDALLAGCRAYVFGLAQIGTDGQIGNSTLNGAAAPASDPMGYCERLLNAFLDVLFRPASTAKAVAP